MEGLRQRNIPLILWILAVLAAGYRSFTAMQNLAGPQQDWRSVDGERMLDFRDTVMIPGQFLLQGGNPYDPQIYLTAHPWAQEFVPYAPTWLTVAAPFSLLPYTIAAGIFLLLMFLACVWFVHRLVSWGAPEHASWLIPTLTLWCQIWYPTRATQETGSSLLVAVGLFLVVREVTTPSQEGWRHDWWGAIGLTLTLIKPTFGLALIILLVFLRRFGLIARGLGFAAWTSLPAGLCAVVASGGPLPFVDSILRDLARASSPQSPTGLLSPVQQRVDIVGLAVRLGAPIPSQMTETLVSAILLLGGGVLLAKRPTAPTIVACCSILPLLVFVHMPYDLVLLLIPAVYFTGRAMALRYPIPGVTCVLILIPVLHIHHVSSLIGLSNAQADTMDVTCMTIFLATVVTTSHRHPKPTLRVPVSNPG